MRNERGTLGRGTSGERFSTNLATRDELLLGIPTRAALRHASCQVVTEVSATIPSTITCVEFTIYGMFGKICLTQIRRLVTRKLGGRTLHGGRIGCKTNQSPRFKCLKGDLEGSKSSMNHIIWPDLDCRNAYLSMASDNEVAQELVCGNHDALSVMLDRYQRLVFSIALRIVRDKGEAEDVVQIVFLEIFRKVRLFNPCRGAFRVWLLRLAYTRSMDRRALLKRRGFYKTVELHEAGPLAVPRADLFDGSLTEHEATRFVGQALETLNAKQRRAIELMALEGMTLVEAAHIMGYSVAATRNYYYRGINALRAFNADQVHSSVGQGIHVLAVGHKKTEMVHFNPRLA